MSNYGNKKESSQEGSFLLRLEQNVINIIPGESNEIRFSCRSRKKGLLRHAITSTCYKTMTKKFGGWFQGGKRGGKPHSDGKN